MTATLYDDMDEAAKLAGGFVQPDPLTDFKVRADQIARRRALAQRLVAQAASDNGGAGMAGKVYMVGNQWGNVAQDIGGAVMNRMADNDQQQLAAEQSRYDNDTLAAIPSEGPARQQAQLKAMQNPSLRDIIKAQMGIDENEARRIEAGEQAAANRVEAEAKAEADRKARSEDREADRQNRIALRSIPATVVHVGNGSRGAADGKPLTNQQEKSALELGSNRTSLQMLADTFKDEYAGDLRSTLQRKFGELAGGAAPQATQDMTRWWANQAMFDELPQRHELFGATLTAGEKAAWAAAAINPSLSPKTIRERMAIRQRIYDDVERRMRGSVEAGGKSVKQFDAAVGKPKPNTPVTIKSQAEWQALPPGTPYTLPDGRKGVR